MRKFISILLVLCMLFALCACQKQESAGSHTPATPGKQPVTSGSQPYSSAAQSTAPAAVAEPSAAADISQNGRTLGPGSIVSFGAYEQDNIPENGKEPIEWLVLEVQDQKALLVSSDILDARPFNNPDTSYLTWDASLIRQWLNSDFYTSAFDAEEQPYVLLSDLLTPSNTYYETTDCPDTQDRVFLLSSSEIDQYFHVPWNSIGYLSYIKEIQAKPSAYALAQGLEVNDTGHARWFLRSPSDIRLIPISSVSASGYVSSPGVHLDEPFGTRPAIWVDLNAPFEILRTEAADTRKGIESLFPADWDGRYVLIQDENHVEVHCKKVYESNESGNSLLFSVYAINEFLTLPECIELGTLNGTPLEAMVGSWLPLEFTDEELAADFFDMDSDIYDILAVLKDRISLLEHLRQVETYGFDLSLYNGPANSFFATGVYQLDCSAWAESSKQELLGEYNHTSFLSVAPDGSAYLKLGSHEEQIAHIMVATWPDTLMEGEPNCLFWLEGGHVLPAYYNQMILTIHGMQEVELVDPNLDGSVWTYGWVDGNFWTEESLRGDIG